MDGLQNVLGSGRVRRGGHASRALGSHLEARYRPLQQVSYGQNLLQADAVLYQANQQKMHYCMTLISMERPSQKMRPMLNRTRLRDITAIVPLNKILLFRSMYFKDHFSPLFSAQMQYRERNILNPNESHFLIAFPKEISASFFL